MTNLHSVLKSRDRTLLTKVCIVKAIVFPVVIHGCESWIIKKAEHQRIDVFELWFREDSWESPWTSRRSNLKESILKEINPEYSLEGLMLKLQYFGYPCTQPTQWKRPWCWERLRAGEGHDRDEIVGCHHHLNGQEFEQTLGESEGQGSLACCSPWGCKVLDMTEQLNNNST